MLETAIFAGGCFWCTTQVFDEEDGVYEVISGYIGGQEDNPTYEEVKAQKTGHAEATRFVFDPSMISYEELLEVFFSIIDPTDAGGQFMDRGYSYRPAIFYTTEKQKELAIKKVNDLELSGEYEDEIVVEIVEATKFWPAEEYHQDFHKKEPKLMTKEKEDRKKYEMENKK